MRAAEARTCLPQPSFGLYRTRISRPPTEPSPGEGMYVSRYTVCGEHGAPVENDGRSGPVGIVRPDLPGRAPSG